MGSEWKTAKLTDHYEIRSGLSKPAKDFGSGYPFLTFKDVFYNYFTPEKLGDLVESTEKDRLGCSVLRGDVFLTRTSETMNELGMSCVALKDYENSTFNGFCKRLRPKADSELVPEYVGYYLRSPLFRRSMMAFSTMSTRASLNNEMISRLDISYPDPGEQVEIARVLKTLDEKISLNNQINQTLEQMAQTLFKSWFVDFDPVIDNALDAGSYIPEIFEARVERRKAVRERADFKPLPDDVRQLFPSEFEESELGWVPKGWKLESVSDAIQINPRVKLPKGTEAPFVEMKALPTSGYAVEEVSTKAFTGGAKFEQHDVLLARITPCLQNGKTGFVDFLNEGEVGFGSTEFIVMRQTEDVHFGYVACLARNEKFRVHAMQSMVGSSGRQRVQNSCFDSFVITLPTKDVMSIFAKMSESYFSKMRTNKLESDNLEKLRDTLLPKLISGELRLDSPEVEHAKALME
ncbi:restriction endonuclease subunit S [Vibrio parahaemolyticus]|uniref:restriction endonuclease subunit S n=1 Tax=Vibrio parahaemolyticus TaxID=670 RepID=UPI0011236DC7|nr:restriction endonuclease subunit S [Vibrio parahaemolyticus]EGR3453247.1 restriction endonuclease subunit S [Vibrio parahaemolyticus]EGR3456938.1 restriction endonuclease subunit S [Vibrio parahaemolyticus]TOF75445.1 restriction endonuclease subunit S [Vibrio parahaemolyticus]TOL78755.1 restriction endonuclease subunit S [Vibrio parahaemolyticus]HCM1571014.1 restriction endonuclease subunit S [Vibrio parahaemolyticus]